MSPDQIDDERRITYFAATHTRGKHEMFGIRSVDRGKHVYVIGKTGMGKSTMLENMAIQDIQNGEGIAFIDPHGSTAEKLLDFVPHDRIKDVIYFAPFDTDHPVGFNVMEDVGYDKRHLVVSGLMGALKRIWMDAWSARMEYILQNTLLALLEYPESTLLDVNRMLTNKTFRDVVVENIRDPIVRSFWTEEFAGFTDTYTREATPAIQNKIGQFTANPLIRNIVGQAHSSFDLRKIMDEKKIFIVNLSKGRMGETNASLLGSMLTVKIYLAAMSRADEPPARMVKLPRFFFYVDEFQSMMNEAFADILSESRKYKLALTLANQYIEQMDEKVRDAVFGNIGTLVTFRVGPFDAETLKIVFEPTFTAEDLVGLGIGQIYLTLMIDGVGSPPFSAQTIPPIESPHISYREDIITNSRAIFGRARAEVESDNLRRQAEFPPPLPKPKAPRDGNGGGSFRPRTDQERQTRQDTQGSELRGATHRDNAPTQAPRRYEGSRDNNNRDIQLPRQPIARPSVPTRTVESSYEQRPPQQQVSLRDAIAAAQKQTAREQSAQSPIDLMRTKFKKPVDSTISTVSRNTFSQQSIPKPVRPSELHTNQPRANQQYSEQQNQQHREQRPSTQERQDRPIFEKREQQEQKPPVQGESFASKEISPETLRRVINDDGGHEQS